MSVTHHRTIWLSDIHLGNKDCKTDYLLDFLTKNKADTLILVGDIIDLWSLKNKHYWPESHNQIIKLLLEQASAGTRIIYIPGNHDSSVRKFVQYNFGHVELHDTYIHTTASGKRILAIHGDQFDSVVCHNRFHAVVGDVGYDFLLFINRWWHLFQKLRNKPYWSLATYLKSKVDKANQAIERFTHAAINHARQQDVDAIVCGHIHHPSIVQDKEILYLNDGDWIENCTCIAEAFDGELSLISWTDRYQEIARNHSLKMVSNNVSAPVSKDRVA